MKPTSRRRWLNGLLPAIVILTAHPHTRAADAAAPENTETSLETLVVEALQANPELSFYTAEIAAARAGRQAAGKPANPEAAFDLGYKRDESRSGALLGDGAAWSVSVAQPFDFPGRLALRKAIANRQVALAEMGLGHFRAGLAAHVRTLGFRLHAAQVNARVTRQVRDRVQDLLAVLVQRDPAGVTPLLETRVIEASAVTLQRRATQAEQAVRSTLLDLNLARGKPLETRVTVTRAELRFPGVAPLEVLLSTARTNNYDLRMRQVELEQQGFQVDLARKERWPQVKLAPFYSNERGNDVQSIAGLGVSLPLPLWDSRKSGVDQAKARLLQAETSLQVTQRQIERQVTDHALAYESHLAEMGRWRTNAVQQFGEAAELGDRHYRLGSLPLSTYLELQKQYLDATEALLGTQADALEHWQQLELLVGLPLATLASAPSTNRE